MGTQIFLGNPPANVEQWIKDHYGPKLDEPLCFTAKQANSTVAMNATRSAPTVSLEYSTDGNTWSPFEVGITTVTLANIDDKVYIRANIDNTKLASDTSRTYNYFVITGTVSVSGNIMTLLKADGSLVDLVDVTNKYVTDNAPWTLAKEGNMEKCGVVLTNVLQVMTVIASLIYPYCPNIAKAMSEQLSYDLSVKLDDITCDSLKAGHLIDKENIKPVFLRIDSELADKKNK